MIWIIKKLKEARKRVAESEKARKAAYYKRNQEWRDILFGKIDISSFDDDYLICLMRENIWWLNNTQLSRDCPQYVKDVILSEIAKRRGERLKGEQE